MNPDQITALYEAEKRAEARRMLLLKDTVLAATAPAFLKDGGSILNRFTKALSQFT